MVVMGMDNQAVLQFSDRRRNGSLPTIPIPNTSLPSPLSLLPPSSFLTSFSSLRSSFFSPLSILSYLPSPHSSSSPPLQLSKRLPLPKLCFSMTFVWDHCQSPQVIHSSSRKQCIKTDLHIIPFE